MFFLAINKFNVARASREIRSGFPFIYIGLKKVQTGVYLAHKRITHVRMNNYPPNQK